MLWKSFPQRTLPSAHGNLLGVSSKIFLLEAHHYYKIFGIEYSIADVSFSALFDLCSDFLVTVVVVVFL